MLLAVQTQARVFDIVTIFIDFLDIYPIELAVLGQLPTNVLDYAPPLGRDGIQSANLNYCKNKRVIQILLMYTNKDYYVIS